VLVDEMVFGRRYRAIEKIGSGGMADVYKAVDEVLGRTVAVKVLHPRYASDPGFVQRFRQEAAAAANLSHPNIVNIYDWGQDAETYYIAMEYVHGMDLKSLVEQRGAIDPAKVADYGAQACAALSVAHGYDIIHRDIKPQNIVLTPDGQIKVMDFGIARAGNTNMTQTGSVLGTAQYVSPEQAQGRTLTAASDLYSLGIVLYELSTGRLPFDGDTPVSVALKQVNEAPVPPRGVNPAVPASLEAVILKAMAKQPQDRYASAEEMRRDLMRVAQGQPSDALAGAAVAAAAVRPGMDETSVMPTVDDPAPVRRQSPPPKKTSPWPWIALAAVLVVAALGGAWGLGLFGTSGVPVPDLSGKTVQEAETALTTAGLTLGGATEEFNDTVEVGVIFDQTPEPGVELEKGGAVKVVVSKGTEMAVVPDLVGLTETDASRLAQSAGFDLDVPEREPSKDVEKGKVIRQTPEAAQEAAKGSLITLVISEGPDLQQVPDVTGKPAAEAKSTLTAAGFKVKTTEAFSDTVKKGVVISQNPTPNVFVNAGSQITISVSKGVETVTVPDVTGKSEGEATSALDALGLQVTVNYQISPDEGFVLTQDPLPGAEVKRGDNVTIWVGKAQM
jgi:beta-lactam-binding protein with PASTA domain/predicted Ser/Thr protein kinase